MNNPVSNNRGNNTSTGQRDTKWSMLQKYDAYTALTMGIEDVYLEINHLQVLRRLPPLKSDPAQRNQSKYCRFYDESGYTTTECFDLKDEIERLIRERRLNEYRAD